MSAPDWHALRDRLSPCARVQRGPPDEGRLRDWSDVASGGALGLILPATPHDVTVAIDFCRVNMLPMVIQGGMTGLVGGAVPQDGEVLLSCERLDAIEAIDPQAMTATVQAGVPLVRLQQALEPRGLSFPVDLGARGSCQIGGMIATNAGGNRVVRHGMMRHNVLGLEAALADGSLVSSMSPLIKNNTGLDLKHLFIGSEGTLGVITRAILRLVKTHAHRSTALVAIADTAQAGAFLALARVHLGAGLDAFEIMWRDYWTAAARVAGETGVVFDDPPPLSVLIEAAGNDESRTASLLEALLEDALSNDIAADAVIAKSRGEAERFWRIREAAADVMKALSPCLSFDVSIPLAGMQAFVERVRSEQGSWTPLVYGHLGDENLHLLIVAPPSEHKRIKQSVYAATQRSRARFLRNTVSVSQSENGYLTRGLQRKLRRCKRLNVHSTRKHSFNEREFSRVWDRSKEWPLRPSSVANAPEVAPAK